jgi:DNA-binding NarL/FixJ family response regulator
MTAAASTRDKRSLRILVVDDHPLFREALVQLIRAIGPQAEILEAASLAAAREYSMGNPDLALAILDLTLADAAGIEAVEGLLATRPELPVLVLSAKDDPGTVRAALEAGARSFISKRSPTRVLADAVRLAMFDGTYDPPAPSVGDPAPKPGGRLPPDSNTRAFTPLRGSDRAARQLGVLMLRIAH